MFFSFSAQIPELHISSFSFFSSFLSLMLPILAILPARVHSSIEVCSLQQKELLTKLREQQSALLLEKVLAVSSGLWSVSALALRSDEVSVMVSV